jgi:hypothetical protein
MKSEDKSMRLEAQSLTDTTQIEYLNTSFKIVTMFIKGKKTSYYITYKRDNQQSLLNLSQDFSRLRFTSE